MRGGDVKQRSWAILLYVLKIVLERASAALFAEPVGNKPPPCWIRAMLVPTCTLVSFLHG